MPQHVRRDPLRPVRQVRGRRGRQIGPQRLVAGPGRAPVGVAPLGAEQRGTRPGVIIIEAGPRVLDEPAQGRPGAVDQRHHPLPRPGPAGALADADVQLAEPAQVPFHVSQIQVADFVDAQPDIGHQPGRRIAAGGRRELPAGRQLRPPPGEQHAHLHRRRRDPQRGAARAAGPVHLIDRALGHPAGHLVDRGLVPDLHEQEIGPQRLGAGQPGPFRGVPQRRAEVHIGVSRLHVPQRPAEPCPQLLQVQHVRADRVIRQAGRRPGQHEPGQHIGLERRQLIRPSRSACFTQVSYDGQAQARASLAFTDPGRPAIDTIDLQETRKTITTKDGDRSGE